MAPTAMGTLVQASTYGATIPSIYGTTQATLLAIWAANIRTGKCNQKKFKSLFSKLKGPPQYVENIDFLIGSNPIDGFLQGWSNGTLYPLDFNNLRVAGTGASYTIADPHFYAVVAVTAELVLSGTFNDYGGNGPDPYSGTYEYPLWNASQAGPDLIDPSYARITSYKWAFGDGATIDLTDLNQYSHEWGLSAWNGFIHIYYASLSAVLGYASPASKLCLTFESILGNGPEYTGDFDGTSTPLSSQQILYPEYSGVGSPDLDLGTSGAIPLLQLETMGSFRRMAPNGDADFCDQIEDVIKSGQLQVGAELGLIQRGVNCNQLPGAIQKNFLQYLEPATPVVTFRSPNTAGNVLIAAGRFRPQGSGVPTIADVAGNSWTPVYTGDQKGFWYVPSAIAAAAGNKVTLTNGGLSFSFNSELYILEMDPGSTVVDASVANSGVGPGSGPDVMTAEITTTGAPGAPEYILGMYFDDSESAGPLPYLWNNLLFSRAVPSWSKVFYRIVHGPGTYSVSVPRTAPGTATWAMVLMAFKPAQPVPYPATLGNIVDLPSLNIVRQQCLAAGLWGSLNANSQKACSDWLKDFYKCANAAPVWSGFFLKSIARSEVSAVGNGAVYTAPTAAGPVATLTESDLIGDSSGPLITIERKAQVDSNNILQVQYFDRGAGYNPSVAAEPLSGAIALYGPRKESPMNLPEIQTAAVARMVLAIEVRRYNLLRNTYKFTMKAKWAALEAMDLILINDSKVGIVNLPVRLTSISENDSYELACEAEPFVYGCNAPNDLPVTESAPFVPNTGAEPGQVNAPVIFEPVPRLTGQQNQAQLWGVVSASSTAYGGCVVMLSTDGGLSYNPVATINGNGTTGVTVGDWPAANDPDTTNNLAVDLTESLGSLLSYQVADEDNFVYPCYVAGGLTCVPYELMTYAVATLTAANKYSLMATGGGTNHLRRAVFGAPQPLAGVDHPNGSRFAFLNPLGVGIFKLNMDPIWIGKTLHFKFLAFNTFGSNTVDQADATDYTYTPNGCPAQGQDPNSFSYYITGGALTNPTSTTIDMADAMAHLPSNTVNYNARVFTIPAPSVPTKYYVTIADPNFVGDTGALTNLTATCQTSNALVGVPANIYIGSIIAMPAGGGTITGPGGLPVGKSGATAQVQLTGLSAGNNTIAHGLGYSPTAAIIQMNSSGEIWWQTAQWDGTNFYVVASDAGVTGFVEVWQ